MEETYKRYRSDGTVNGVEYLGLEIFYLQRTYRLSKGKIGYRVQSHAAEGRKKMDRFVLLGPAFNAAHEVLGLVVH